jgi:hypothetical protein
LNLAGRVGQEVVVARNKTHAKAVPHQVHPQK